MTLFKKICLICTGLLLTWFGIVAYLFFTVPITGTIGEKINLGQSPDHALIIIDLFNYTTRADAGILNVLVDEKRAGSVINSNNAAIDYFRKDSSAIIFVYQAFEKWSLKSLFVTVVPIKGSYKAQIDTRLHKEKADPEFNKPQSDAFSNPELQTYLAQRKIGTLFISGSAAEACVYSTVWGARNRGYQVYVIDEATYPFLPEKKNETYIKYRNLGAKIISIKDLPSIVNESSSK